MGGRGFYFFIFFFLRNVVYFLLVLMTMNFAFRSFLLQSLLQLLKGKVWMANISGSTQELDIFII